MACSGDNLWKSIYCACIYFCILIGFFVGGIIVLGVYAVSEFQTYRKEDIHHIRTSCVMESVNVSAVRDCTYGKNNNNNKVHSTFPCVQVTVSYNGSVKGFLFRSSDDAMDTQYECIAYECEKSGSIYTYVDNLNSEFECFYNSQKPYFVFIESKLKDGRLIHFTFACFIIICLSPVLVFLCSWCKLSMPKWSTCRKYVSQSGQQLRRAERFENLPMYIRHGRINDVKKNLEKAKINTEITVGISKISLLALAAQHGQHAVMVDLCKRGANMHYIQPRTGKTILHFACENGKKDIIDFCLCKRIPINVLDHMNRTPLMTYVEMGLSPANAVETLKHLIKLGADVTLKDKDSNTALHYACKTNRLSTVSAKREIFSVLIRAGCVSDYTTSSTGNYQIYPFNDSPLCFLLYHGEFTLGTLLIESGYVLKWDLGLYYVIPSLPRDVQYMLVGEQQNPAPLLRLCRTRIRKSVGGIRLQKKLKLLPMPKRLIKFLQLKLY